MIRSHLRLASVAGAIVLSGVAMAPALGATNLSSAGANALTISVAGNENGTGNVTATNDGSGEKKTGDTEAPISDSGAQDFLSAGVLAQEATARATNGTGTSAACAGLAGDGGSVVNLGGSECLKPTNQVNGSLGSFDPSTLLPTVLGPLPSELTGPLSTVTDQLSAALAQARAATDAQFGDMGLTAGVKVIEGRCTASPGQAQGSARIVDGKVAITGGGQTITLLNLPVNPPPNTHVVTDLSKVLTTVISALRTNLNTSLDGGGAPLNAVLDPIQQQVVNTIVTQVEKNLAPLEQNVLDITLNKQVRPTKDSIRVNALDLQLLPAAREQLGSSLVSLQIGNVVCGPSGREATAAPAAPVAPKAPRLPTAVSAGYGDMPAQYATEDKGHTADFVLAAFAVLVATGAGAVTFRRLRR
ncbi:MAG: hypothetical protein ABWX73_06515 [Marmoricola sp.]